MDTAPAAPSEDRSVIRRLRRAGDTSRDGRGRITAMPPILQYGFRPFFFLGALHAGGAIPVWLALYLTGRTLPGPFTGLGWHAHEMLFGYLAAVITGFVLTAVPNWTGNFPLSGWRLAGLVALWLAGRVACALVPDPLLAAAADLLFPLALAVAIWREVLAGRNWKNLPVAAMISLFGIANALHHGENYGLVPDGLGVRLAMGAAAMLIALIGGRIVPSFTRNWLVKAGEARLPASFGRVDRAALVTTGLATVLWVAAPGSRVTGAVLVAAGTLLAARLVRWNGHLTFREPILFILHAGYVWLAIAFLLLGVSSLWNAFPESAAIHALTAGAIGTMTLAVMTRASLGHTGREIAADRTIIAIYCAVTLGAVFRVTAPFAGEWYTHVLACGGALWSAAFLLFALRYAPVLYGERLKR